MEASHVPAKESVEFARVAAFTDGVFAIAITLLVLSLEVPDGLAESELGDYLVDSWGQLFAYFLSFAVIGRYWLSHHELFGLLRRVDQRLIVLNLVYLSMIVLIPFPTELLGEYGNATDTVVLYAVVVGTASLLSWVMLRHMLHREHLRPGALARARALSPGALLPAIVFYVSIPVALVSPTIGQLLWLALLLDAFRGRGRASATPAGRRSRRTH
jgi:uncharacterized membrane protein